MARDLLAPEAEGRDLLAEAPTRASVEENMAAIEARRQSEKFEEPSTISYFYNRLKKGLAGFMGAPGDLIDMSRAAQERLPLNPFNAVQRLLGKAGVDLSREAIPTDKFIATSKTYRDAAGVDENMKTSSDLKRYAGGVLEMAGAGGPFTLSMKAANIPALVTSTVGSGIGMEAGGDVASGLGLPREAGEAAGALTGGLVTAVAPNAANAAGSFLKRRFSPEANKAAAESGVAREIAGQLESYPPAARNIERSLEVSERIPGFNPSLPARSNAPGLLAEEQRIVSKNPKTLNKSVERIEENSQAIKAFVDQKFQPGSGSAVERVRELSKAHVERLEGMKAAVDDKLDDAMRVFESNPTNYENGIRLRELFQKQKELYSGIRGQKYQAVYDAAEKLGVKANIDDAVQYADDVLKNEMNAYQASEIPPVFRQIAKLPPGEEVSFAKLHSLYKRANADLASARASNSVDKDFRTMLLEGLKTKLTDKIRRFEDQGFGEVATKLKEANRFYAEEYVPRFKQGFGGDIAAKFPTGEYRTPDQAVTELITKRPNNTQAAKDFNLIYGESEEALRALRAGYLDELYRNGGLVSKEGRINQKALDTFIRKHEPTLSEFPEIHKELKQLALDNGALLERRAELVTAEKRLAAKDLYKLFNGRDPNAVLAEATSNPNAMRVLAFQARNDKPMAQALARGVAEHVAAQADPAAFLAKNEQAIRTALKPMGDEHFKNLATVVEAISINRRNPPPTSVNAASVVPDSIAESLGSSPRAIISHFLNIERGRTGVGQEGAAFLGRWFDKLRRDHKAVVTEAVFYDKDTAKALSNLIKEPKSEKAQLDFATQMMALGVRAEVAGQE